MAPIGPPARQPQRGVLKLITLSIFWGPPQDIDLLGRLSNDLDSIRAVITEVCQRRVDEDGLAFDPASVVTERIAEDADYEDVRATFQAKLGDARIAMQVDIGVSDVITPAPAQIMYPSLLEQATAELFAQNRETAIAEKYEAMVMLAELNSRMKDNFDFAVLAANFEFEAATLGAAIIATIERRGATIDPEPVCFSDRFAAGPLKAAQCKAFVRRSLLSEAPEGFPESVRQVRDFIRPIALQASRGTFGQLKWLPGGPWQS
ncbi:MAG TPA: nucleotidyl transferase AbiEii/AbiGii toxin family protein [Lacipirellulaceae bacterium]|nr:nucleotidyl transferase AbiEii/AbiGii toxin family protein [Lacipirellulaceae bacterium]